MRCCAFVAAALVLLLGALPANSASHGGALHRRSQAEHNALVQNVGNGTAADSLVTSRENNLNSDTHLAKRFDNARYSYYYVSQGPVACNNNRYQDNDYVSFTQFELCGHDRFCMFC